MFSIRKKAISGTKWTGLSNAVITALQLLQFAVLARLLAPEDFGLIAIIMVVIGFAQAFGDMGISNAIIYRQDATREELSSLYWLSVTTGLLIAVFLVLSSRMVSNFYADNRLNWLIIIAAVSFLATSFGQQFQVLLQKELMFTTLSKAEMAASSAGVAVSIVTAFAGQGVFSLSWGVFANSVLKSVILAAVCWKRWRPLLRFRLNDIRKYVSFGLFQMGERLLNYFGGQLDKLFIGYLLGMESLGYYSISYQLMMRPLQVVNPVITRVALPVFAKMQSDDDGLRKGYLELLSALSIVLMPVYMGLIVVADPLLTVFLGEGWGSAVEVFKILSVLGFFYFIGNPIGSLLIAKGRADLGFYLNVLMIILYAAAIWLGSYWGINGIAWGLVFATAGVLFPTGFAVRWMLVKMRPLEFLKSFSPFLSFSILMAVCLLPLQRIINWPGKAGELVILSLTGFIIYAAAVLVWQRPFVKRLGLMIRS
ncbi:MAG: MOP flippase family protein [Deltaproteobacteria bacterium]|nr:MOP flippase family protein [Deltaproteobacteria bacterium]